MDNKVEQTRKKSQSKLLKVHTGTNTTPEDGGKTNTSTGANLPQTGRRDSSTSPFPVLSQAVIHPPHKFAQRSLFSQKCKVCNLRKADCEAAQQRRLNDPKFAGAVTVDDGHMTVVVGTDRKIDGDTSAQRWAQRWMVIREEYHKLQEEVAQLQEVCCVKPHPQLK